MKDCLDFISAKEFNRLTEVLERNTFFLEPKMLDDDYFNQIETILMGISFESSSNFQEFIDEELDYLNSLESLEAENDEKEFDFP